MRFYQQQHQFYRGVDLRFKQNSRLLVEENSVGELRQHRTGDQTAYPTGNGSV